MKLIGSILAGATLALAPAAMAQNTPQQAAPAQTAPATAATATAATNATVTDAEVSQFATAALEIEKIRKDTTLAEADKGTKMAAAATTAGLTAERFNAIGQAMQSDTALNQRIQAAATAKMAASGETPAAKQP
jgi:serine protease inhibitor